MWTSPGHAEYAIVTVMVDKLTVRKESSHGAPERRR
jgi:hypothetical protein